MPFKIHTSYATTCSIIYNLRYYLMLLFKIHRIYATIYVSFKMHTIYVTIY